MTISEQERRELLDLLWSMSEGSFSPADVRRLEELVDRFPEARTLYVRYMAMCGLMHWERGRSHVAESLQEGIPQVLEGGDQAAQPEQTGHLLPAFEKGPESKVQDSECGIPRIRTPSPQPLVLNSESPAPPIILDLSAPLLFSPLHSFVGGPVFSYMVATVILAAMLLGAWAYKITHYGQIVEKHSPSINQPQMQFVGQVTGMKDCRWSDPQTETYLGASAPLGRQYALASGLMQITYDSGAKVILEGPCTYEVESTAGGFLSLGKLTATVVSGQWSVASAKQKALNPKSPNHQISKSPNLQIPNHSPLSTLHSPLFSVRTPTAIVTDLGTEFGVEVDKRGNTTSHVFQGQVQVAVVSTNGTTKKTILLKERESLVVDRSGVELLRQAVDCDRFARCMAPNPFPGLVDLSKGWLVFSDSFDADLPIPSIDYENFSFSSSEMGTVGGKSTAAVSGGVLRVRRIDGINRGTESVMTRRKFSGRMVVSVDIGSDGATIGNAHVALRLGDLAIAFHPGYSGFSGDLYDQGCPGAFRLQKHDKAITPNIDMGFVPDVDTLHHLYVYYDGKNEYHICLIHGRNPRNVFRSSFTDPDGSGAVPFAVGVHRSGGANTGMFDNLRVYQLPDTYTSSAPTAHNKIKGLIGGKPMNGP